LIPVEPYRLDSDSLEKPSRFKLELLIDEIIYEFSFAVTRKAVTHEKLVQIQRVFEPVIYWPEFIDFLRYRVGQKQLIVSCAFEGKMQELFFNFLDEGHPLYSTMNEMLPQLDTGISHLGGEEIPFENIPFPESFKSKLQEDVKEGMTI
jgi:hypothetical protein